MKTLFSTVVLSLAMTASASATANAEKVSGGFALAERGRAADCTIILPASPTPAQKYAAEELRDFTERLTGVKLPIVTGAHSPAGRTVVFEDGGAANPAEDGFRIKVDGGRLTVTATPDRGGPLYAVYELLERFAGCRWYASWCERVPVLDRFAVPSPFDETHVPAFAMRQPYWYDVLKNHAFAARLRANTHQWGRMEDMFGGEHFRYGGGLGSCHTFAALLPIEKYGKDHPEYFALHNGKRCNVAGENVQYTVQPCLTNPDVLDIVTAAVLERIRKDPGAKFYGVSQNDNWNYCQCERCAAVDAEEESHAGTVVRFVNAVAERVEKEFPDAVIETLAYQFSRKPPKKTRLRKNVIPCLCSIECDFARPIPTSPYKQNVDFRTDIKGWSAMTDQLYLWDYVTDFAHYTMPFPNVLTLQDNIRFFRDNGVKCLFEQGAYQGRHGDFAELKTWLMAKWMWDPELPLEGLLDDFFAGYYGAGAPFVRAYFDELHRIQLAHSADPEKPLTIYVSCEGMAASDEFLEKAAGLFEKAAAAVKDDPVRSYNVRMAAFAVDYIRLQRKIGKAAPLLVMDPAWEASRETAAVSGLAKSLLACMDEAKDIRLCESSENHRRRVESWRNFSRHKPRFASDGRAELEESVLSLANPGTWGAFVDDPQAADGKALKLFNTHYEWCTTFKMAQVTFRPGVKYTIRVRARVEPKAGVTGEAFWSGVYDPIGRKNCGNGAAPKTNEMKPGYAWYDVTTWEPKPADYFWIGPGRFGKDPKRPSAIEAVYIDKIEFVEQTVPGKRIAINVAPGRVMTYDLRGDDELVVRFPQCDVQARWTPLAPKASLPWTRSQGRILSSADGAMPLLAFISQADSNRLTVACSELVRPVETFAYLKYENGSVFEVSMRAVKPAAGWGCRVRIDARGLPFQTTVAEACDWLRSFPENQVSEPPAAAYEPLWNSWYSYRTGVTAVDMEREGAAAAALGVKTLVYDMGWDRPGARDSISFRACGDWRPDPKTFPDFTAHLARQHARGLRCLLWFGYPLMGLEAKNFAAFKGKCLSAKPDHRGCLTLNPALPEVRSFVGDTLVKALAEWKADGFKIDFIQSFGANGALPDATRALMEDLRRRIGDVRPDALVEYMSIYGGIAAHRYCTHVRATDCPGDAAYNRWQTANLRLVCGKTAVHSDMVTWDDSEPAESAALQIVNVLHAAIQYGRSLVDLPEDHARMVRHWTRFAADHRETLLKGAFRPRSCLAGYPLIETEGPAERIIGAYAPDVCVDVGSSDRTVHVINGTGTGELLLRSAEERTGEICDTFGNRTGEVRLSRGVTAVSVPRCGIVSLGAMAH